MDRYTDALLCGRPSRIMCHARLSVRLSVPQTVLTRKEKGADKKKQNWCEHLLRFPGQE